MPSLIENENFTDSELSFLSSQESPDEFFIILEAIGAGSYGEVYKAKEISTGELCAIKSIPVDKNDELSLILNEVKIIKNCHQSNVVSYKGCFLKKGNIKGNNCIWIVMEYCGGGSVDSCLKKCPDNMTELEICAILKNSLQGLQYLHSKGQMHRDIKAANILLNELGEAKLADFGVSTQLTKTIMKKKTFIGTPYWMAPEVILSEDSGESYDLAADIWSIGITALEMAHKKPPFYDLHPMRVLFLIPKTSSPHLTGEGWSASFHDFIAKCLIRDPMLRPSVNDLILHPFFWQLESVEHQRQIIRNFLSRTKGINSMNYSAKPIDKKLLFSSLEATDYSRTLLPHSTSSKISDTFIIKEGTPDNQPFFQSRLSDAVDLVEGLCEKFQTLLKNIEQKYYCGIVCKNFSLFGNESGLFLVRDFLTFKLYEFSTISMQLIDDCTMVALIEEKKFSYLAIFHLDRLLNLKDFKSKDSLMMHKISASKYCTSFTVDANVDSSVVRLVCVVERIKILILQQQKSSRQKDKFIKIQEFIFNSEICCYNFNFIESFLFVSTVNEFVVYSADAKGKDFLAYQNSIIYQSKSTKSNSINRIFNKKDSKFKNFYLDSLKLFFEIDKKFFESSGRKPIAVYFIGERSMLLTFCTTGLLVDCERSECLKFNWPFRLLQSYLLTENLILLLSSGQASIFNLKSHKCNEIMLDGNFNELFFFQNLPTQKTFLMYEWNSNTQKGSLKNYKYEIN